MTLEQNYLKYLRCQFQAVLDYLLWHHFGDYAEDRAHDLVNMYKNYFTNDIQVCKIILLCKIGSPLVTNKAFSIESFQFGKKLVKRIDFSG